MAMWLVFASCVWNAFAYQYAVVAPMVTADNWLFLDTFLRQALEDRLGLGDFLVKRAGLDHAQPLNKLLMLLNYRVFGLDLRIEGMVGLVFAVAGLLVIYCMVLADTARDERTWHVYGLLAAIAAIQLSLNSSAIYSFSLVTLGFIPFFFAFATIWAAWRASRHRRWGGLFLAMLVYGVIGDTSAILLAIALVIALIYEGWRGGRTASSLRLALVVVLAVICARLFYAGFGEVRGATLAEFNVPTGERVAGLLGQWRDWWKFVVVPAASGLAYAAPLQTLVGPHWRIAQVLLGTIVLSAHGWFWWRSTRAPAGAAWFLAIVLMLLFYAYLGGLLMSRVFVRGAEYLDQPRYVSFYQVGIVALLVMACAPGVRRRSGAWLRGGIAAAIVLLQLPLSWSAAQEVVHIRRYYLTYAEQLREISRAPESPPEDCLPTLTLCPAPFELRVRVLRMARDHRVNVYSQWFHDHYPEYWVDPESLR